MKNILTIILLIFLSFSVFSQEPTSRELSREEVMNMSVEELSDLPLEELMNVMDIMGVSSMDQLYNLIMNKGVKSASKRLESAFDSPLSSSVLTKKEIEISGATTIEEALRLIPGVIVREKTNGNYDIHLRGLDNLPPKNMLLYSENTNTLLMVDGRPMFNYAHGAIVWESLPVGIADIDRIEVVRGASSALYGPNAVNGVINILTMDTASDAPAISGNLEAGTQNTYTGNLALRNKWNNRFSAGLTTNFQSRRRETDKVSLYENGNVEQGFYSLEEYDALTVQDLMGERKLLGPGYNVNELYPDPGNARENIGVNAYLQYMATNYLQFDVSAGFQDSYINSTTVGDTPAALTGRKSRTGYGNILMKWGHLSVQTNYTGGVQDFAPGEPGFKVDMGQFNTSAEYNWQIKRLNLKPGVSFQSVYYDDTPHLEQHESGYLNGNKELNTLAASIRAEFLAFGKLRLISALRTEKYNYPDEWYPSWQFAGTLPIGDHQRIRAVYSRANRSSFIINSQSDYMWNRSSRFPQRIHFGGNEDYELMTTDMLEIGYRVRPARNILIEAEIFGSENRNFGALLPYQSTMAFPMDREDITLQSVAQFAQMLEQGQALPDGLTNVLYQNLELNARQIGGSLNLDWIISEKLIAKLHGTIQETMLDDYSDRAPAQRGGQQMNAASDKFGELIGGILMGEIPLPLEENYRQLTASEAQNTDLQDNVKHKSTPTFWGMASLTYRPTKKFEITSMGYYLGKQTLVNQNATVDIDPKFILNAKAAFKPNDQLEFFLNARNALNNNTREFAFMDKIGGIYLAGIRFAY